MPIFFAGTYTQSYMFYIRIPFNWSVYTYKYIILCNYLNILKQQLNILISSFEQRKTILSITKIRKYNFPVQLEYNILHLHVHVKPLVHLALYNLILRLIIGIYVQGNTLIIYLSLNKLTITRVIKETRSVLMLFLPSQIE